MSEANIDIIELNEIMQKLLIQREEAMKLLEAGRLFTVVCSDDGLMASEELPTTIVERAKWVACALAAESQEVDLRGKRIKKLTGLLRKVRALIADKDLGNEIDQVLSQ